MQRIERGSQVPHFDVVTIDGLRVRYGDVWQQRNLVLVCVEPSTSQFYVRMLQERAAEFTAAETALVISAQPIAGFPCPGVVVADRWGEVVHVFQRKDVCDAEPTPDELLDWIGFVRMQCPECPP